MTTLLLTGTSGLVGSRLLPRLIRDGHECRALVRDDLALPPGAGAVRGDPGDPASLRTAVEGVDAVVHLAALFRTPDDEAIWRANLDGTRHLVEAVRAYAPRARFVMTSTGNVYEMAVLAGDPVQGSADPLVNPWSGRMDSRLLREIGFRPSVPTIRAAAAEGIL